MSESTGPATTWPADVIHVNEDGWVLINRGAQQGVPAGMRLLVVGSSVRELRDICPPGFEHDTEREEEAEPESNHAAHEAGETNESAEPVVLRTRRTYELLEVVHVEPSCAIAIAARTPADRRPQFYHGPHGELLVWVPLPPSFTYPKPNTGDEEEEEQEQQPYTPADEEEGEGVVGAVGIDVPPQRVEQEDERWEEALPLNGVGVGDQVVPAMPVGPDQPTMGTGAQSASSSGQSQAGSPPLTPFEKGQSYDWMKPQS